MGSAYELQDTIHSLKEENQHLQNQLENLTHALQDLKHLFSDFSKGEGHNPEYQQHAWKGWSQHGISRDTQQILEHILCSPELHGSAETIFDSFGLCFLVCVLQNALALW
uniref:Uncharacterized protein n=1 Tax=Knipowitschia caucasica TaxID=637954 RepID=A0AAV2MQT7_KNICA